MFTSAWGLSAFQINTVALINRTVQFEPSWVWQLSNLSQSCWHAVGNGIELGKTSLWTSVRLKKSHCGAAGFKLRQRALHVYSEKERVPLFKQVCDSSASPADKTLQLAKLMNDSQDSCRCGA